MKKVGGVVGILLFVVVLGSSVLAAELLQPEFKRLWERQDFPVSQNSSDRSWTWGPVPISDLLEERLAQSPGGKRRVQYFDKSRMEINHPDMDPNSEWYVTNGLLPIEMMTGKVQTGEDYATEFDMRGPARISAIGDEDTFPTYADLLPIYANPGAVSADELGKPVTRLLNPGGSATEYTAYAGDPNTVLVQGTNGHGVPQGFVNYMNQEGVVYVNGQYVRQQLYNPLFVFGHPVTAPYWVNSKVGGQDMPILFQVFERRVITYNPANPPAFQIEMGNVGRHYFTWRYGGVPPTDPPSAEPTPPPAEPTPPPAEPTDYPYPEP